MLRTFALHSLALVEALLFGYDDLAEQRMVALSKIDPMVILMR